MSKENRWIPVTERLPIEEYEEYKDRWQDDEDPAFIVMIRGAILPTLLYFDGRLFHGMCGLTRVDYRITHWMPLPEPPQEDTE